jgi:hypothetical protein
MQIKNNFKLDIKPYEWLYIVGAIVVIVLVIRGDIQSAIGVLKSLIPTQNK